MHPLKSQHNPCLRNLSIQPRFNFSSTGQHILLLPDIRNLNEQQDALQLVRVPRYPACHDWYYDHLPVHLLTIQRGKNLFHGMKVMTTGYLISVILVAVSPDYYHKVQTIILVKSYGTLGHSFCQHFLCLCSVQQCCHVLPQTGNRKTQCCRHNVSSFCEG